MTTPTPLPQQLKSRDKERLSAYKTALDFYQGNQWPGLRRNTKLRRLTVNYVRAIVGKTTAYVLKGNTVGVQPRGRSDVAAAAAELALRDVANDNALARLDHVTELDTAVLGDGAYKVTWDPTEERVVVTAPDVAGLFVWPHPADPMRFQRAAHRYQLPAADVIRTWGINPKNDPAWVTEDWTDQELAIFLDDAPAPLTISANPYGFIPFVLFPNEQVPKRWWGESDVTPLIEVAKELNAQFSRLSNVMELSGNPIAVLSGVENATDIETFPGSIWELPEKATAQLLDLLSGGGVTLQLDYLKAVLRALHDISEAPRTAFGDNERDLSGVALQVELQPLLQKVDRKRLIRTDALRLRAAMVLQLLDAFTNTNHLDAGEITVTWEPPFPADRTRDIVDATALVAAGLSSRRTSMADLGQADPDAEWKRWQEEQRAVNQLTPAAPPRA